MRRLPKRLPKRLPMMRGLAGAGLVLCLACDTGDYGDDPEHDGESSSETADDASLELPTEHGDATLCGDYAARLSACDAIDDDHEEAVAQCELSQAADPECADAAAEWFVCLTELECGVDPEGPTSCDALRERVATRCGDEWTLDGTIADAGEPSTGHGPEAIERWPELVEWSAQDELALGELTDDAGPSWALPQTPDLAGATPGVAAPVPWETPTAGAGFKLANPAVITVPDGEGGTTWVSLSTGSWDRKGATIATAPKATGPWKRTNTKLLTERPKWMSKKRKGVWAPSIIRSADGDYVVYYSGIVKGSYSRRCIGTARSDSPTGPFTPYKRPIACWKGSGTNPHDPIFNEGGSIKLIDATPAKLGDTWVLTYKTAYRKKKGDPWHTTIRMLEIDPHAPQRPLVDRNPGSPAVSIKIADTWHKYIEENPVIVKRGGRYTLFTSFGWYGTCDYWTRYRQNTKLWSGWLSKKPKKLPFPPGFLSCGRGNAHAMKKGPNNWRLFFNGHYPEPGGGPRGLYVGKIKWNSKGRPRVSKVY